MQSEDRVIHFSVELLHRPSQLNVPELQKLYFELSQLRGIGYDNTDFSNPMQARFYSKRGQRSQSIALFLPDRTVLIEEWADIPMSGFLQRVREVGVRVLAACGVPEFVAHTATIRSTFALTHFQDSRQFILDQVCEQAGKIGPFFQRPIATGGLRFVLPETEEHPGLLHVGVESFKLSQNEILADVKGVFTRPPVNEATIETVLDNVKVVRSFITDHLHGYLEQYDQPQDKYA